MQFLCIFSQQIFLSDHTALQQSRHKSPGAGERIKHMHILITDRAPELLLHHGFNGMNDEIHHFSRRVNNAQLFAHLFESDFEELVVKFNDHFLLAGRVINAARPFLDRLIEPIEDCQIFRILLLFEQCKNSLHAATHGVIFHKRIIVKERIKHRLCHQVLTQHFHGLLLRYGRVDILA